MTTPSPAIFDADYYKMVTATSELSASVIVPLLLGIRPITSVVDVGCGPGVWMESFRHFGVDDIVGVDGAWAEPSWNPEVHPDCRVSDLAEPLDLAREFDLAICLEVAQYLDRAHAETLVESLIRHSNLIAFSSAVPGQAPQDHPNEQWQSWWGELFETRGYVATDPIRPAVWTHPDVAYWFAQNLIVYVRYPEGDAISSSETLAYDVIHPLMWRVQRNQSTSFRYLARQFAQLLRSRIRREAGAGTSLLVDQR